MEREQYDEMIARLLIGVPEQRERDILQPLLWHVLNTCGDSGFIAFELAVDLVEELRRL